MRTWCPRCQDYEETTEYKHYNNNGKKLTRSETVCTKCHITLEVRFHTIEEAEKYKVGFPGINA